MEMSRIQTRTEDPPDLWMRAFDMLDQRIKSSLQQLEQTEDQTLTLSERIQNLISSIEKKHDVKAKKSVYRVMGKIVSWLNKFKEIGDIAVQYDPIHAALPWAGVRFLLQSITAEHGQMEAIAIFIERVARLAHHGRVYESVYTDITIRADDPLGKEALYELRSDLVKLYSAIMRAVEDCCSKLIQKTLKRLAGVILNPDRTRVLSDELWALWECAQRQAQTCDKLRIGQISDNLQRHFQEVSSSIASLKDNISNVKDDISKVLVKIEEDERSKTLEEISKIPYASHHVSVSSQRTKGTGEWLLQLDEFKIWHDANSSVITLLYGIPGAGKTFLVSKIIDRIIQDLKENPLDSGANQGLAYFYCQRQDENRRQPKSILRSFVRQLASPFGRREAIHQALKGLPRKLRDEGEELNMAMCQELLISLIKSYSRTTIILDALDECDPESRDQLMECLDELTTQCRELQVFISSRTDPDIRLHFCSKPIIHIQATDNQDDIETFVQDQLRRDKRWPSLSLELQDKITTTLFKESKGMFQWASLQIQQLKRLRAWVTPTIRDRLGKLPRTLEDAYDEIWKQIQTGDCEQRFAERAFQWVLCAQKPLTTDWLVTAIMVDPNSKEPDHMEEELDEEFIKGVCCNLLVIDKSGVWRFSHLSAAEYMETHHFNQLESHRFVGRAYLKYLITTPVSLLRTPHILCRHVEHYENRCLCSYVIYNWAIHVQTQEDEAAEMHENDNLKDLLREFLGSVQESSEAYLTWKWNHVGQPWDENSDISPLSSPLYGMSFFGLLRPLRDWWEDPGTNLNMQNSMGLSLLSIAIKYGHEHLWRYLISKNVNLNDGEKSPLEIAMGHGREDAILALLDAGADINHTDADGMTPLGHAIDGTWKDLGNFRLILDRKPDLNLKTNGRTPLEYALESGRGEAATALRRDGAELVDLNVALVSAANGGLDDWITWLIKQGADVNYVHRQGDSEYTSLMAATTNRHMNAVKLLLKAGASVNMVFFEGRGTALAAAARYGHSELIQLLLDAGADPDLNNGVTTPLIEAV
ncbi:hypothetical protein BGZ63DRAFT_406059 [Mariannaea sp. PMI_226]|nr:hypothetical protein BGZ63DRAFT_406059 [Mariannaea sp. PMI_226]